MKRFLSYFRAWIGRPTWEDLAGAYRIAFKVLTGQPGIGAVTLAENKKAVLVLLTEEARRALPLAYINFVPVELVSWDGDYKTLHTLLKHDNCAQPYHRICHALPESLQHRQGGAYFTCTPEKNIDSLVVEFTGPKPENLSELSLPSVFEGLPVIYEWDTPVMWTKPPNHNESCLEHT